MNNLKTLLKYTLINSLGINKLTKKKNGESRGIGLGLAASLIYLLIFAFVTLYMFIFVMMYKELGDAKSIYLLIITVSSLICFITTISKANTYIFRTKDYDFLMSLPIKSSTIIVTKLLSLYLYNLLFVVTLFLSVDIAYIIGAGFDAGLILLSIPAMLIIPFFPMTVSSFIAFLLGFIPLKQKTKNLLSMLLYIIMFGGFMAIYFYGMSSNQGNAVAVYDVLGEYYFLGKWLFDGMANLNVVHLLLFLGISVGSFLIFVIIVGRFFLAINGMMSGNRVKSNYKLQNEKYEKKGEVKTIFQKEVRSLLNYPQVLIQIASGPIMSIVMAVMMPIVILQNSDISFGELGLDDGNLLMLIVGAFMIFTLTLVSSTASSISLEGKSFWIIKCSPVKTTNIFWGKCLVNIILTIPIAIIDIIIIEIFFKANIIITILVFIMIVGYVLFTTFMGLVFNLLAPKFDYDNPVKAVKQGKPVLYTMLMDFGIIIVTGILLVVANMFGGIYASAIAGAVLGIVFCIISYFILFKKGPQLYDKISA